MHRTSLVIAVVILAAAGCSDDSTPLDFTVDHAVDSGPDVAPDVGADLGPDSSPDTAVDTASDAQPEVVLDLSPDLLPDMNVSAPVYGTITRTAPYVLDGKGTIYVGLYFAIMPPPMPAMAQAQISAADLSAPGASVNYQILGVPTPGDYLLYAFLDDNNNADPVFISADSGDLVTGTTPLVTIGSGQVKQDLVLDTALGAVTDGGVDGPGFGAVKGNVSASVTPKLDGKGTIYIYVQSQPGGTALGQTVIPGADLSSPYNSEAFFIGGLPPGNNYLQVFLDDNANVNLFAPGPDPNDMTHSATIEVRIEQGVTTVQDVTLDKVL